MMSFPRPHPCSLGDTASECTQMVRPPSRWPLSACAPCDVRQPAGISMSLSWTMLELEAVAMMCARRTLLAWSARSVSTGCAVASVSISKSLAESGTTVQKTPRLNSGHLVRRYSS